MSEDRKQSASQEACPRQEKTARPDDRAVFVSALRGFTYAEEDGGGFSKHVDRATCRHARGIGNGKAAQSSPIPLSKTPRPAAFPRPRARCRRPRARR